MFGRRPDGKRVKGLDGLTRMTPLFLGKRSPSANLIMIDFLARHFDDFIKAKQEEGIKYNYRDIMIAIMVRVFYTRPKVNRFIIAGKFYQRKNIDLSMMVHKSLRTGDNETAVKVRFIGTETIAEVKQKVDTAINTVINETVGTDAFTKMLGRAPTWFLKIIVGCLKLFDRWGMLSDKFLFTTSPFHCSAFFADLKSVRLDRIYHHLYNFGNCGFFTTMGKEELKPVVDPKTHEIKAEQVIELGVSVDDRTIDGLYYSHVFKSFYRIIENLSVLERAPDPDEVKTDKPTKTKKQKKKKKDKKQKGE